MTIYSKALSFEEATQISENLRNLGYFVEYPFQIPDEQGWFFNVYTDDHLDGDWIYQGDINTPWRVRA